MVQRRISRRQFVRTAGGAILAASVLAGCDNSTPPSSLLISEDFSGEGLDWGERWLNLRYANAVERIDGAGVIAFPAARHLATTTERRQTSYLNHPVILPDRQVADVRVTARLQLEGMLEAGVIARASFDEAYALLIGNGRAMLCRYDVANRTVLAERPLTNDQGPASMELTIKGSGLRGSINAGERLIELSATDSDPLPAGFVGVVANALDERAASSSTFRSFRANSAEEGSRQEEILYRFTGGVIAEGGRAQAHVTARSVIPQPLSFELSTNEAFDDPLVVGPVDPGGELGAAHIWFEDLELNSTYYWRPVVESRGDKRLGSSARFRTPPPPTGSTRFIFCSCTSGRVDEYPSFTTAAALDADFMLHAGDWGYADHTSVVHEPDHFQARWVRQLRIAQARAFFATTPLMFWQDDHDYQSDNGWAESVMPYTIRAFDELHANPTDEYFDVRWGDLHVWCIDCRMFATDPEGPDDSSKSRLGEEQKAWLREGMTKSDAPVKVVASPMVFRNKTPEDPGWHNVYTTERDELLAFFGSLEEVVFILSGDAHGQRLNHHFEFGDLWEFNCSGTDFPERIDMQDNYDPEHTEVFIRENGLAVVELDPQGPGRSVSVTVVHPRTGERLYRRSFSVG